MFKRNLMLKYRISTDILYRQNMNYLESTKETIVSDISFCWNRLGTYPNKYCHFNVTLTCSVVDRKCIFQCPKLHTRVFIVHSKYSILLLLVYVHNPYLSSMDVARNDSVQFILIIQGHFTITVKMLWLTHCWRQEFIEYAYMYQVGHEQISITQTEIKPVFITVTP